MTENLPEKVPASEIIFYQTEDGQSRMSVRLENETVWLTQAAMAELFQRDKSVISRHIRNIFDEGELAPDSVVANFATTADDGTCGGISCQGILDYCRRRQELPSEGNC